MRGLASSVIFLLICAGLSAREVPLTILHTCDLHGNVLPTEDYAGTTNLGGIARCATAIRQVRAAEKNVLLVDAGDTIQGAAISYLSGGQVMVKALNHLRYDAWVWGNHEFDWGLPKLLVCAERAEMPILNANVAGTGKPSRPATRIAGLLKPYILRDVDGVKVAIIGLNTPGIPNWSRPRLIEGLRFVDSVEALASVVRDVREAGARVIVLVCHQGFKEGGDDHANQVRAIAQNYPELDVIIGGHTHRDVPEFKVSNVLYCQANYYGIHLGRVDLVYDTQKRRVTTRRSNTLLMDERVPLDADLVKLLAPEIDHAHQVLATTIGKATGAFDLRAAQRHETPIHALLFEAIADAFASRNVRIDAIVHGILDRRATLEPGAITIADVWRIVPYENTLGVAHLLPAQLREILDENAGAFGTHAFRGIWGLRWMFNPDAPAGQRVTDVRRADGSALPETERLAVAFNSYDLASGGLRWKKLREIVDLPAAKLTEYDFQTREVVIDYIRKQGTISPRGTGWWKVERQPNSRD
jgi:2',3'-cyclic-nucleotide 2'-phosphodiesterase (5'-nucleotidase family)